MPEWEPFGLEAPKVTLYYAMLGLRIYGSYV